MLVHGVAESDMTEWLNNKDAARKGWFHEPVGIQRGQTRASLQVQAVGKAAACPPLRLAGRDQFGWGWTAFLSGLRMMTGVGSCYCLDPLWSRNGLCDAGVLWYSASGPTVSSWPVPGYHEWLFLSCPCPICKVRAWSVGHVTQSCLTLCEPARLLCLWNSSCKNSGVGCHSLL